MAINQISAVVDRLQHDVAFRGHYQLNPDSALAEYRLSGTEIRALKTGNGLELELMGLGQKWDEFVAALCGSHPGD